MKDTERKHWVSVAAAIVRNDGRVLAIRRRDNQKWEPPGGTLEPEESIHEGLIREVWEETGLSIEPGPLSGVYKNMRRGIVALVFRCEHPGTDPRVSDEVVETRWMTAEEVEAELDPAYACRLLDALKNSETKVRVHDGVDLLEM